MFKSPMAATGPWWDRRYRQLRRRAPLRYFLQKTVPMTVARTINLLRDQWWKVRHRTTDRYHVVKTSLKPGYHDYSERMLYACFSLLVDYVEIGIASKQSDSGVFEASQRGLAHLDWEISDCPGSIQSETAKVIKDLYLWWTIERPQRLDPWDDANIWRDVRVGQTKRKNFTLNVSHAERVSGEMASSLDEFYEAQDADMMLRLVSVRSSLWT